MRPIGDTPLLSTSGDVNVIKNQAQVIGIVFCALSIPAVRFSKLFYDYLPFLVRVNKKGYNLFFSKIEQQESKERKKRF